MLIGISRKEVREYITTQEKGVENPTVFLIGNMLQADRLDLIGTVIIPNGSGAVTTDIPEFTRRTPGIVKAGLKGIKNFFDPEVGRAIDIDKITDDIIEKIPFTILYEIAGKIIEWNCTQGGEQKN